MWQLGFLKQAIKFFSIWSLLFALNGNKIAFHAEQFFIENWIENAFHFCNPCVTLKDHSNWVLKCYNLSKNSGPGDVLLILTVPSAFSSEYRSEGHGILAIDWGGGFWFLKNENFHKGAHMSLLELCRHNCLSSPYLVRCVI